MTGGAARSATGPDRRALGEKRLDGKFEVLARVAGNDQIVTQGRFDSSMSLQATHHFFGGPDGERGVRGDRLGGLGHDPVKGVGVYDPGRQPGGERGGLRCGRGALS